MKSVGEENIQKLESFLYLQVIDQSWKDHLHSLDGLRDSVSLRGYGQRDPLQEYKKEAFSAFAAMIDAIESEATFALLKMPAPELRRVEEDVENSEEDYDDMNFTHSEAPALSEGRSSASAGGSEEESQQPYVREGKKVGRNDACPCGSGKKYKKCHGVDEA